MSRVWFVTGTDTGVGKTVATAALVVALRDRDEAPYVFKPAQTGVGPDEDGDLAEVRRLSGPVPGAEGVRLEHPLAPDAAARVAGVTLPPLSLQTSLIVARTANHPVLVEGAGGLLVNLGDGWNLLDLAAEVARTGTEVRWVVVARAGLGTLNHSALTVQAIQQRGGQVAGVVIGSWPEDPDLAAEQNLLDLPTITGVPLLGRLPEGAAGLPRDEFEAAARTLELPRP